MSIHTHTNAVTGRTLKAENIAVLDSTMRTRRFAEPKWATFQQWKGSGRAVMPGETAVALCGESGFTWRVFNVAQTEGGEAEAARAAKPVPTPAPAAPSRKATTPRAGLKKVVPSGARSAPAVKGKTHTVSVAALALREALEWTRRAASTDGARYYLNGIYFAPINARELELVATDGHRMHAQRLVCSWQNGSAGPGFIMRPETVTELLKEIGGKPREVSLTIKDTGAINPLSLAILVHGGATITSPAIDGTFPDYDRVVPQARCTAITLSGRAVFDGADRAMDAVKDKAKGKRAKQVAVKVALDANGVSMTASGSPHAYFNARYLRDMARIGDTLAVEFAKDTTTSTPVYFSVPGTTRWGLLMPMLGDAPQPPAGTTADVVAFPSGKPHDATPAAAPATDSAQQQAEAKAKDEPAPVDPIRQTWRRRFVAAFTGKAA